MDNANNASRPLSSDQKLTILFLFFFFILVSSLFTFSISVLIMQLLLGLITVPFLFKKDPRFAKLYILIFVISLSYVFIVYLSNKIYYGEPYYIGGSDDLLFEQWGFDVYYSGIYNPSIVIGQKILNGFHNSPFFPIYISLLIKYSYFFDGYSTFLPRIINVYFLIWSCFIIEYLLKTKAKFTQKNVFISIAFFALNPNIQYINSHIFRDTLNLLQTLLIVYVFDKIISKNSYLKKIIYPILLGFILFITYFTRKTSLAFAGALCLLTVCKKIKIKEIYVMILTIPIILMTNILNVLRFERYVDVYTSYILKGSEGGLSTYVFRQPLFPLGIFLRALYAFISPFPNFLGLFSDPPKFLLDSVTFFIYLGVIVQILFVPFIIKRIIRLDWLSLSFLSLFLAVVSTTFTFRHVLLYYPFMVAVATDGYLTTTVNNRKISLFLTGLTIVFLGFIYVFLKVF